MLPIIVRSSWEVLLGVTVSPINFIAPLSIYFILTPKLVRPVNIGVLMTMERSALYQSLPCQVPLGVFMNVAGITRDNFKAKSYAPKYFDILRLRSLTCCPTYLAKADGKIQ